MQTATGRVSTGLAHALAVWLAAFAAMSFARSLAAAAAVFTTGLLAVLLLAARQRRHDRPDTAVGLWSGALLWPLLAGALLIAVNIASMSTSPYE